MDMSTVASPVDMPSDENANGTESELSCDAKFQTIQNESAQNPTTSPRKTNPSKRKSEVLNPVDSVGGYDSDDGPVALGRKKSRPATTCAHNGENQQSPKRRKSDSLSPITSSVSSDTSQKRPDSVDKSEMSSTGSIVSLRMNWGLSDPSAGAIIGHTGSGFDWLARSDSPISVCGFDLDGTLIVTKSGKTFPVDYDDWKLKYSEKTMKQKLVYLSQLENTVLFIYSNQKFTPSKQSEEIHNKGLTRKLENIVNYLGIPFFVFMITNDGRYRKPSPDGWQLIKNVFGNRKINIETSCFVGDAAGRPGDHSAADRCFSENYSIPFITDDEFFMSQNHKAIPKPSILPPLLLQPDSFIVVNSKEEFMNSAMAQKCSPGPEQVVMVMGPTGSGKSRLCRMLFPDHVNINQDHLKTVPKCITLLKDSLKKDKKIVIDRMFNTKESRQVFLDCCREFGVSVKLISLEVGVEFASHCNRFRTLCKTSPEHRAASVPPPVLMGYYKNLNPATEAEGFSSITRLSLSDFVFGPFGSTEERKLFTSHLIEFSKHSLSKINPHLQSGPRK